jgi:hypothetical protein
MPKQVRRDAIVGAILQGIQKAQREYKKWSGGDWLWEAPEYLITVYVAEAIASIEGPKYVTIERSTKATMDDAGAITKGRISKKARPSGRVDIVVWWKNGSPSGVIEIKNQVRSYSQIAKDVERIDKMLHKNHRGSSFQFGCVAFYTSARTDRKGEARKKLIDCFSLIQSKVEEGICDVITASFHNSTIYKVGDSAWSGGCLLLNKKGKS